MRLPGTYISPAEIGLYYLQSRYYDADTGRFVNGDEIEYTNTINTAINHNLYCYCENNCVNSKDESGNISWEKITSILAAIAKGIKKIFDFLKKICNEILKLYTGLNPKDISSIAKDINRSPHRVRQSVQRIITKMTKIKSVIGKLAIGVTILSMIASLGKKAVQLKNIVVVIADCVVETVVSLIKSFAQKILKPIFKLIPVVGVALSFIIGVVITILSQLLFTPQKLMPIKNKVASSLQLSNFNPAKACSIFFKSL